MTRWSDRPGVRGALTAVQFLSRLPVPGGEAPERADFAAEIARGLPFFPLVGALLGAITGLVLLGLAAVLPWPLAVLLALAFDLRLTGCFHEDAVADFCDAFGGGRSRTEVLEILRDSRLGSYGTAGLVGALALRAAALIALNDALTAATALVISGCVGRLAILVLMATLAPVPERAGLARDVGARAPPRTAWAGLGWALPVLLPSLLWEPWRLIVALLLCAGFLAWLRALLLRRLGGSTGDALGFGAYGAMLIVLIVLAACR